MSLAAEAPHRYEEEEEVIEAVVFFMLVPSSVALYEALGRVHTSSLFSRKRQGLESLGRFPMLLPQMWVLLALTYSDKPTFLQWYKSSEGRECGSREESISHVNMEIQASCSLRHVVVQEDLETIFLSLNCPVATVAQI